MNTILCKTPDCGQMLEIKIASGYKDPKNKGKKYTKCLKCDGFEWITNNSEGDQLGETASGVPTGASYTPKAPVVAQKPTEVREVVREPIVDPKVWENKDLRIARESALHSASRNHNGKEIDPALLILEAEEYVKYIYGAITAVAPEDVELPSEVLNGLASPVERDLAEE